MESMSLSIYWHAKALIPIYSMISCKICSKDLLKNPSSQIKAPRDKRIRNHWKKPTNCYFLEGVKRSLRTEIIDRYRTQENTTKIILIYYAFLWISLLFCIIIDDFDEYMPTFSLSLICPFVSRDDSLKTLVPALKRSPVPPSLVVAAQTWKNSKFTETMVFLDQNVCLCCIKWQSRDLNINVNICVIFMSYVSFHHYSLPSYWIHACSLTFFKNSFSYE